MSLQISIYNFKTNKKEIITLTGENLVLHLRSGDPVNYTIDYDDQVFDLGDLNDDNIDLSLVFDGKNGVIFTVYKYNGGKEDDDNNDGSDDDFSNDIIFNTRTTRRIIGEGKSFQYSRKRLHFNIIVRHFSIAGNLINDY